MCRAIWLGVDQDCIPPCTGAVSLGISSLLKSFNLLPFINFFLPKMPTPHLHELSPLPIEFISHRLLAHILGYLGVHLWPS
jgi:hypothetical protein